MSERAELQRYVDEHVRCSHADIRIAEVRNGVVSVALMGACSGCPGAADTVRELLEGSLMSAFPEIKRIEIEQRISDETLELAKKLLGGKKNG